MLGRPRYLFAAYVGRDVATEALQKYYKEVTIKFKLDSTASIWGFLHQDVFALGVVPRTFVRRF
ncbi:uncharacterized protein BDZ99DRAFT_460007 [Mytilinidion resinicola]|uniref:Uncharacterized protein n=1 Tax=Mytilinidion resinicola TaxID=574789 RepID=A0A6A6Z0T3_9PEZI|nr:uncharacterized protein BDZ99DRAFT_460007 [Mytilinidion resinicola]KAF2814329.1 hypothetical protein BDZ99DRAFT_460007 [Mytilinidion resinicola]